MSLERLVGQDKDVFQKQVVVTATKSLEVFERVIIIGTLTGNITLTLPPVAEAVGKIFTVYAPTVGTDTQAVTLEDHDNDSVDWTDKTLDADGDGIMLLSDGRIWWVLDNRIA